ncbi:MAG: hypothetical protein ACXWMF_10755, partial [Syntrophales bacterium]
MYCEVNPSDADLITRLINFNNIYLSRYLNIFSQKVLHDLHKCELYSRPAFVKSDLKDVIVANPPYRTQRIDELISG